MKYLQHHFWTWAWPLPPPLWTMFKKTSLLENNGFPELVSNAELRYPIKALCSRHTVSRSKNTNIKYATKFANFLTCFFYTVLLVWGRKDWMVLGIHNSSCYFIHHLDVLWQRQRRKEKHTKVIWFHIKFGIFFANGWVILLELLFLLMV